MNALDIIEQLEALSPAELQQEINEQRDRLLMMERVYALLTGDEIKTRKQRQPRKPRTTSATASQAASESAPSEDDTPPDSIELRRRLVDLLTAAGPLSWSQLVSQSKAHMSVLGPALREAQVKGQIEKVDGLYRAVGK